MDVTSRVRRRGTVAAPVVVMAHPDAVQVARAQRAAMWRGAGGAVMGLLALGAVALVLFVIGAAYVALVGWPLFWVTLVLAAALTPLVITSGQARTGK